MLRLVQRLGDGSSRLPPNQSPILHIEILLIRPFACQELMTLIFLGDRNDASSQCSDRIFIKCLCCGQVLQANSSVDNC